MRLRKGTLNASTPIFFTSAVGDIKLHSAVIITEIELLVFVNDADAAKKISADVLSLLQL